MRIVPKLTAALVAGMCLVLGVNGWFRVQRETTVLDEERQRRHRLVGHSVGSVVESAWKSDGEEGAVAVLATTMNAIPTFDGRWLPAGSPDERHVDAQALAATPPGVPVTGVVHGPGARTWFTYVPVAIGGIRRGEIELSEQADDAGGVRTVITETVKTAVVLVVLSALLAFLLNQWLIGRPVRVLTEKARRIGRGDFGSPIEIRSGDELALLAREMNAMSERLGATIEQLRHADRLTTVGRLAAGVAHELGTPLNVVSARAEMIASDRTSVEDKKDYAKVISGAAARMTEIIRHLLQFARRNTGERARRDVSAAVRATVEILAPLARKRRVEVDVVTPEPIHHLVDTGQIQQVVTNLVMNAVQASPEGATVEVRVDRANETPPADVGDAPCACVRISVHDRGAGIDPVVLPHIFEPFFTTKDVGDGTGLGLAVSWGIVRDHDGWIRVETSAGAGTTFVVCLPLGGEA